MNKRMARGFTLLEVLIVLVVLGILLAIAVPNLMRLIRTNQVREAAQVTAAAVRRAGGLALTHSRSFTLSVSTDKKTLSWADSDNSSAGTVILPNDVQLSAIAPSGPLAFSGRGLPVQQVQLTVSRYGISKNVVVLPTGKVLLP